jgi:hypothetical protein
MYFHSPIFAQVALVYSVFPKHYIRRQVTHTTQVCHAMVGRAGPSGKAANLRSAG